jgi:hypothetical protein
MHEHNAGSNAQAASLPASEVKPRIRLITPVWGRFYINRWLDLSLAALRSEGNIPFLNKNSDFELAVVTKSEDAAFMQADPKFNFVTAGIRVKFITMDEFFPPNGEVTSPVPLTLAYGKAIQDLGEDGIGTYVILMNADFVLASGSLRNLLVRIRNGFTSIAAASIRVIDAKVRLELQSYLDERAGILSISPRAMMRLANPNLHSTITGRIINDMHPIDSTYYHQIYWRISHSCLALRGFLLMPVCFQVKRIVSKVLCPVDYGVISEVSPGGRFCVLNDSDDYLMIELQERDSESHLLRLAPNTRTLKRRLARLAPEIAANAATWTTADHRRAATQTAYFHESGLPSDVARRVKPLEEFVDDVLATLPPPVSHIGHFQWLPAVSVYRKDMIRGGSNAITELLDDPRNLMTKPPSKAET